MAITCLVAFLVFARLKERGGISEEIAKQFLEGEKAIEYTVGKETVIIFHRPFIRMEDFMRLGMPPSFGENKNGEITWMIEFNAGKKAIKQDTITVLAVFRRELLCRLVFPVEMGRFLPPETFYEYLRILGDSHIDAELLRTVRNPSCVPNLEKIHLLGREAVVALFGLPDSEENHASKTLLIYRLTRARSSARPFEIAFGFRSANDSFDSGGAMVGGYFVVFSDNDFYIRR